MKGRPGAAISGTRFRPVALCVCLGILALLEGSASRTAGAIWFDAVPPDPHLEALLNDILTRNPGLAAMGARTVSGIRLQ